MNDISIINDFILNEYYKALNMLECGKEVDISDLKNALSIRNAYMLSKEIDIDIFDVMPNIRYYISYYKL